MGRSTRETFRPFTSILQHIVHDVGQRNHLTFSNPVRLVLITVCAGKAMNGNRYKYKPSIRQAVYSKQALTKIRG